jgi:hypothetical protein
LVADLFCGAAGDPADADRQALNAEGAKHEPEIIETTAVTKPKADELKVVIIMKDARFMIGVQAPDCDPVSEVMEGNMEAVLARVPGIIEAARAKWATSKRNPKADLPTPPPPPPRVGLSALSGCAAPESLYRGYPELPTELEDSYCYRDFDTWPGHLRRAPSATPDMPPDLTGSSGHFGE